MKRCFMAVLSLSSAPELQRSPVVADASQVVSLKHRLEVVRPLATPVLNTVPGRKERIGSGVTVTNLVGSRGLLRPEETDCR